MAEATKAITIAPYDYRWKSEFSKIKAMLNSYIGDQIIKIEHVGSTSVEGLGAKPIIDVDVVMDSYEIFPIIVERLAEQGFIHLGNVGIEGREAFKRSFEDGLMTYHLYVCPIDGKGYLEHIALRDYLRNHPNAKAQYYQLKTELAMEYKYDIESYCNHKTEFIKDNISKTIYKEQYFT